MCAVQRPLGAYVGGAPLMDAEALIARFFHALPESERVWLALSCSLHIDNEPELITNGDDAVRWLARLFHNVCRAEQRFGRVLHLVSVIDFELSAFALTRMVAEAERRVRAGNDWDVRQGRWILQQRVPMLRDMIATWNDLRHHELDEAALWIYRDELHRRAREDASALLETAAQVVA
jgi:hypothetical protein